MKKISIIIPYIDYKDNIERCVDSILKQSYSNIELLIIGDISEERKIELSKKDNQIKNINCIGYNLYKSIIQASKELTGDYISIINSNDYLDLDYCRLLINDLKENNSDISIANIVRDNNENKTIFNLSFNTNNAQYDSKEFFKIYLKQTGRDKRYSFLYNKLVKRELWDKCIKVFNGYDLKDNIDLFISTVLYNNSSKISFNDNSIYYESISNKLHVEKDIKKRIEDISKEFSYIIDYLKKKKVYNTYKKEVTIWNGFELSKVIEEYNSTIKNNKKTKKIEASHLNIECINIFNKLREYDKSWNNINELETEFIEDYNDIKKSIMDPEISVVSFDLFDTLVTRPFFLPHEMFYLLNKHFISIFKPMSVIDFSIIRRKSENELRDINNSKGILEVTLDEIYDYIANTYKIDREKLDIIKNKEIEMELHFCRRRNSGYELYSLARQIGKRVILTSDIYLPKKVIKDILNNNGYKFDKLYISSELLKTKSSGELYEDVIETEKTTSIIHIGDNYDSDYLKAKEYNIKSSYLPKTTHMFMGYTGRDVRHCGNLYRHFQLFNQNHIPYEENYGVRSALGMIANYYFDNPYRPFNSRTDFNADPYFIGYYALGMHLISICKWLLDDVSENKVDSISFMARDGYLPYKAVKEYKTILENYKNIKLNYTYVSRKALMPLLFKEKNGISLIDTYINYDMVSPKELIKQFSKVITTSRKKEKEIDKEFPLDKSFESVNDFNKCLSIIYDKCFDKEKYNNYYKICKKYFDDSFTGNASTFDIGYSGKPEAIISSIIEKPIITYFIHTNNSSAFNNLKACKSKLKTFYDYKPTVTGTIRELFISNIEPSCVGYIMKDNKVEPELKEFEKYNYYNIDMINRIQNGALDFIKDYCYFFKEYIEDIDLNKYYMSLPLEYYFHYANLIDRLPTKNLIFENNVNNYIELNDYIFKKFDDYTSEYTLGTIPKNEIISEDVDYTLPNNKYKRVIYYLIKDRKTLIKKLKNKR